MKQFPLIILFMFFIIGCSASTPEEQGALGGAVIGAGAGAVVGHGAGSTAGGVAVGALAGSIAGSIVASEVEPDVRLSPEQEKRLEIQRREIARQQKELENLKRQEYHDQRFKKYETN